MHSRDHNTGTGIAFCFLPVTFCTTPPTDFCILFTVLLYNRMLSYREILEALHREMISDSDLTKIQKTFGIDNSDGMPQNAGEKAGEPGWRGYQDALQNRKYTMGVTLSGWTAGSR